MMLLKVPVIIFELRRPTEMQPRPPKADPSQADARRLHGFVAGATGAAERSDSMCSRRIVKQQKWKQVRKE